MKRTLNFTWDERKNDINKMKHGISFRRALLAFSDPMRYERFDLEHSETEDRWKLIGLAGLNLLVVIFTETDDEIRIISARKADDNETKEYFNGYGKVYTY